LNAHSEELSFDVGIAFMVNYMHTMKVNSKMWVLESRLHPHCEGMVYDASIVVVLPSFLLQIVIENVHTCVITSYSMQIIPLKWKMLQKVNCNNVLGKLLQNFHGDKCYKMVMGKLLQKCIC